MRPESVNSYLIDENSEGDLLFVLPDLGALPDKVWFAQEGFDLVLIFDDGERVRLPTIPEGMLLSLTQADKILIAETDDEQPLRCYEAERAMP